MPLVKANWANADQYTPAAQNAVAAVINSLIGMVSPFAGPLAPTGWLLCYGQAVSRATYVDLFNVLNPPMGPASVSIAAPGVVTFNSHGLFTGDAVYFTTTGALPTGLLPNTVYYVAQSPTTNTFSLSTTFANAIANTRITTTGSQSGVHTLLRSPYGVGDGSTTFNVPDLRGRITAGQDNMGGSGALRLNGGLAGGIYGTSLGTVGGEQGHQLTTAELASHSHPVTAYEWNVQGTTGTSYVLYSRNSNANDGVQPVAPGGATSAGSDNSHNNVQPTMVLNYIIKT